jgi:hypothetical protein
VRILSAAVWIPLTMVPDDALSVVMAVFMTAKDEDRVSTKVKSDPVRVVLSLAVPSTLGKILATVPAPVTGVV